MINHKKFRLPIKPKKNAACQVCGRLCHYKYYGVWSCESCKQFFRRVVLKGELYKCSYNGECEIVAGDNCRSCRFRKCLLVGMKPDLVNSIEEGQKSFAEFLKEHQENLMLEKRKEETIKIEPFADSEDFCDLLNRLIPIERAYHRIWDSPRTLPEEYSNRHNSLEELLKDEQNLLTNSHEFPTEFNVPFDENALIEELDKIGLFSANYLIKTAAKDWMLSAETAKAMPFFKMLNLGDQISLLKQIFVPIIIFCSAFYSYSISAQTVTRAKGFTPICYIKMRKICKNQKVRAYSEQNMCEMVERMHKVGIKYEEFVLLLTIIFANSSAENLSSLGRELLYAESIRYTKALHKMLQIKFGLFCGTRKFASLMELLNLTTKAKHIYERLTIYLEVIFGYCDLKALMPKALRTFS